MNKLEDLFKNADFSSETDFKETLRNRLFGANAKQNQVGGLRRLSLDDISMVNAAGDVHVLANLKKDDR